ncbi:MAG: chromate transporter [Burkholderiales bacterium]|nr:chromate transporter [Burkholderiales bacterium]
MNATELLSLFLQCCLLSLLTIGGYATVLPDLQRQLVAERGWLSDAGFAQGVALGQVVPGPNILVIGVLGWMAAGAAGLLATLIGILLPSSLLVWRAGSWVRQNRDHRLLLAFQVGSMPLVLGLTLASAWLLAKPMLSQGAGGFALLALISLGSAWRAKWPPLLWLAVGAAAGVLGWI